MHTYKAAFEWKLKTVLLLNRTAYLNVKHPDIMRFLLEILNKASHANKLLGPRVSIRWKGIVDFNDRKS